MASIWVRAAVLVALTVGAASCGEGDAAAPQEPPTPYEIGYDRAVALVDDASGAGRAASDREAIAQTLRDVQLNLAAANGEAVCDRLTPTGVYELARLRGGGPGACASVVAEIGERRRREHKRSKVSELVSADVFGRRASALLRDPSKELDDYRVPFARDGAGRWRLTSLVLLDADAIDNPPVGPSPPFEGPPRRIPREDLVDVQTDFARDRGESVCDDLTAAGRREAMSYGGPGKSCPEAVRTIKDRLIAKGHQLRSSRLLSVSIDGGRATLLVKDAGRPAYRVPVVVGPGNWKLTSLRDAEPIELARP